MDYKTLIFYKYIKINIPKVIIKEIYDFCVDIGIVGRIIISSEGINGSISGTNEECDLFIKKVTSYIFFTDMFIRSSNSIERSFKSIKVKYKKKLLQFGTVKKIDPLLEHGKHLDPQVFFEMKDKEETVILDVRNNIEHKVGKFRNAITLDIDHFRDFPDKINELKLHRNKKILTYCTAGIRCEIATAFLKQNGFNEVYQLEGGILNYAKVKGGVDFFGKCYVFDERQTIEINTINPMEISKCEICNNVTSKIINCANPECNHLTCICEKCADKYEGCCSEKCKKCSQKRIYKGKGYFSKK